MINNEEEKEYLIIKGIVTTITLIIATLLILLFITITKVEAQTMTLNNFRLDRRDNTSCGNSSVEWTKNNCFGNFYKVWSHISNTNGVLLPNNSYSIKVTLIIGQITLNGFPPNVSKQMLVNVGGQNWVTATADRNQTFIITPNYAETPYTSIVWNFEIDSNNTWRDLTFEFIYNNGTFDQLVNYYVEINNLTNSTDSERIVYSIDNNTNEMKHSFGEVTNKMHQMFEIEEEISTKQNTTNSRLQEIANSLSGIGGTSEISIENSKKNTTDSQINNYKTKELNVLGAFKQDNLYEDMPPVQYNHTAWRFIWGKVDQILKLDLDIKQLLLSIIVILFIGQVLRKGHVK